MKKKLNWLAGMLFLYLLFAFGHWNWNPGTWGESRAALPVASVIYTVIYIVATIKKVKY